MDMLLRVSRSVFLVFCIGLIVCSCKKKQNDDFAIQSKILSESILGERKYDTVYRNATDSISSWISNQVSYWKDEKLGKSIELDSLLCFNQGGDKLITALLAKTLDSNYTVDGIHFFYGVKITNKWYFFKGPFVVLFREGYQKDLHAPLSFTKLHEIAMQEVFSGYLKKKDLGFWRNVFGKTEYEVNEAWFASHFEGPGWDRNCRNAECYE